MCEMTTTEKTLNDYAGKVRTAWGAVNRKSNRFDYAIVLTTDGDIVTVPYYRESLDPLEYPDEDAERYAVVESDSSSWIEEMELVGELYIALDDDNELVYEDIDPSSGEVLNRYDDWATYWDEVVSGTSQADEAFELFWNDWISESESE